MFTHFYRKTQSVSLENSQWENLISLTCKILSFGWDHGWDWDHCQLMSKNAVHIWATCLKSVG